MKLFCKQGVLIGMDNHKSLLAFCDGRKIVGPNADLDMVMQAIRISLEQSLQ